MVEPYTKKPDQFSLKFYDDVTLAELLTNIFKSLKNLGRLHTPRSQLEYLAHKIARGLNSPDDWDLKNDDAPLSILSALRSFLTNSAWECGKVIEYPNGETIRVTLHLRRT